MMNRKIKSMIALIACVVITCCAMSACGSSSSNNSKGRVYFLNFKPEVADQWKEVAEEYTKETGVEVKVETPASGTYEQFLKGEISKGNDAPTLFQVNGPVGYANWQEYASDLKDTEIYNQLISKSVALSDGNKIVAIPYVMETYGLIYNKDLLSKYISLPDAKIKSVKDINCFDKLKEVADDIQARKGDLGIDGAFTSSGFDSSSDWRFKTHLANLPLYYEFKEDRIIRQPKKIKGSYLDGFKKIFDLYLKDSTVSPSELEYKTGEDAIGEFAKRKAVFYQNGTWAWSELSKVGMKDTELGMLPIYIGAPNEKNQGLATGSENYWCINNKTSDNNKKATKDFLKWLVLSDYGKDALSKKMGFNTPFRSLLNVKSDNPLSEAAMEDARLGKVSVSWNFTMMPSDNWKNNLGSALLEYAKGSAKWDKVKDAFVQGWTKEYAQSHAAD